MAETKVEISTRAQRWEFALSTEGARELAATQKAGAHLQARIEGLFGEFPPEPTQLAAMAIAAHELFIDANTPTDEALKAHLRMTIK